MNFKKILSLFMGLNLFGWFSISVLGCGSDKNKVDLKENKLDLEKELINKIEKEKVFFSLKEELSNAKSNLATTTKINAEFQKQIKELQQQKNMLQEQIKELKRNLQDKSKSLIFFQEDAKRVTEELHQAIIKLNELETKLKRMEEYNNVLQDDSASLEQKIKLMKKEFFHCKKS